MVLGQEVHESELVTLLLEKILCHSGLLLLVSGLGVLQSETPPGVPGVSWVLQHSSMQQ